jgi:hypothetical protein
VLTVHDRIAKDQLERIDLILATCRHFSAGSVSGPLTRKIRSGEDGEPDAVSDETMAELAGDHGSQARGRCHVERQWALHRHRMLTKDLDDAVGSTPTFGHHDYAPAVTDSLGDLVDCGLSIAPIGLADLSWHRSRLDTRPGDPIG